MKTKLSDQLIRYPYTYADLQNLQPKGQQSVDWAACCEMIPPLAQLDETPQDPIYHAEGDVGIHTRLCLAALQADEAYQKALPERQWVLFMATLLHDIAKSTTTVIDPVTGRIGQPGHSKRGSVDTRLWLWRAGVPVALREAICRMIAVHQIPFYAFNARNKQSPEYLIRSLSWQLCVAELVILARADMLGRVCQDAKQILDEIECFAELAKEEQAWEQPAPFATPHTALCYFRGELLHPPTPRYQIEGSQVTVMSGLPASGKDTWVATHRRGLPVVSFDAMRQTLGLKHGANEGAVAHATFDLAKQYLRNKQRFVWNATHLSLQMRQKTLDLLFDYHAEVELVHLEQPLPVLLARNHKRDTSLSQAKLLQMLTKWEVPLPTEAHRVIYS